MRRLKSHPLGKIDARRPFDCPDRRKPTEQILGQMLKIGPRKRRCSAKGSFQLFEEDFLLCEPGIYLIDDLLGEEAEFEQRLVMLPGSDADENSDK